LDEWVRNIQEKKITVFDSFIKTLQNHKQYIANYVKDNLSNAVTEGLNNLVRSIRRVAFGMPNFNNLRLRVMAISTGTLKLSENQIRFTEKSKISQYFFFY
jgi:transposase